LTPSDLPASLAAGLASVAGYAAVLVTIMLVVLVAAVVRYRARKRAVVSTEHVPIPSEPAPAQGSDGDIDAVSWEQRILAFALELRRSASRQRVHQVIAQKLPGLLGVERVWVVARFGDRRHVIVPHHGDAPGVNPLIAGDGDWATFPLKISDRVIGILGVDTGQRTLPPRTRRAMTTIAPLIAESLYTLDMIAQLRELSSVDQLTGCATRQSGVQRLQAELTRAHRASREVAILLFDLDYFKSINDRFGHHCGDAVLSAIGRTLLQTLRVSDIRCRWGGEEFLVVLPEAGIEQAKRVAVTLARRIAETLTHCDSARISVTTSVGITISSRDDEDPDVLLARADKALYRAKTDGRNCVRILLREPAPTPASYSPQPPASVFQERRDAQRTDRRQHPGFGRRKTDVTEVAGPTPPMEAAGPDTDVRSTPA
jgi:diguanylate cyclase (GGDEF)-like protein